MPSSQWITGAKSRLVVGALLCYVVGYWKIFEPLLVVKEPITFIVYPPARRKSPL
jgi:hypothetical protein